ncbi:MAG: cytochrome c, partial [Burkholderiaceae bacterium]
DDLRAWGDFVAKLPPPPQPAQAPDAARLARGRAIVEQHRCVSCHNPDFSGREQMPRLANQREDYLLKSMRDYKSGARKNPIMSGIAKPLTRDDIRNVAAYLSSLSGPLSNTTR